MIDHIGGPGNGDYANTRRKKVSSVKPIKSGAWKNVYRFDRPPGYARSLDTPSAKGKDRIKAAPNNKKVMLVNRVGENFNGELFPLRNWQFTVSIFAGEGFGTLYRKKIKVNEIRQGEPVPKRALWFPDSRSILVEMKHIKDFEEITLGGLAEQTIADWAAAYSSGQYIF